MIRERLRVDPFGIPHQSRRVVLLHKHLQLGQRRQPCLRPLHVRLGLVLKRVNFFTVLFSRVFK